MRFPTLILIQPFRSHPAGWLASDVKASFQAEVREEATGHLSIEVAGPDAQRFWDTLFGLEYVGLDWQVTKGMNSGIFELQHLRQPLDCAGRPRVTATLYSVDLI